MTRRRIACVTLGAALDLIATAACAQTRPESRYTPLTLARPHCVPDPGPAEGFSCKGLAGWTLDIGFPAFGASLGFVRGKRRTAAHVATDGRAVSIDGLPGKTANVEWRGVTKNGAFEPYAAILRVLAVEAAQWQEMIESGSPSLDVKRAQILVVTRLGREGSCVVAYVDAQANAKPNDLAREAADDAALAPCPVARIAVRGVLTPVLASYLNSSPSRARR